MPNPAETDIEDDQIDDAIAGDDDQDDGDSGAGDADAGGDESSDDAPADSEGGQSDEGKLVIGFGEDSEDDAQPEERAPAWVRDLRKQNRELVRRNRELERTQVSHPVVPVVGPEPTLESCDNDTVKFASDLKAWAVRKSEADGAAAKLRQEQEQETQAQTWQRRLVSIDAEEVRLKVDGADDARDAFMNQLSPFQQAAVLQAYEDPKTCAMLRYALGRNQAELAKVSQIQDPVRFVVAITELRQKMRAKSKSAPPKPETRVRPGALGQGAASAVDNQLERLRKEADKSGDRSKVVAYLAQRPKQRA